MVDNIDIVNNKKLKLTFEVPAFEGLLKDYPFSMQTIIAICSNEKTTQDFLMAFKLVATVRNCSKCASFMRLSNYDNNPVWRCNSSKDGKRCNTKIGFRLHSYFRRSKAPLRKVLLIMYFWWMREEQQFAVKEADVSKQTVTDWYSFCRCLCRTYILDGWDQIGGPGKIVEIDESKFGKRKYNKGKRVDGCWVFGAIERPLTLNGKPLNATNIRVRVVEDRKEDTLLGLINDWILPGTMIYSDCWAAYNGITEMNNYGHLTVNHSTNFVDPSTGCHTNRIEGQWRQIKAFLPRFGIKNKNGKKTNLLNLYLYEYTYRLKKTLDQVLLVNSYKMFFYVMIP
mmetsp:Transcript_12445/g.11279  ORF Transcript_12445/g.11279 Transcript_12445/m.11279 type:complete len:340 (-) Transcript_12445:128-1147(-)